MAQTIKLKNSGTSSNTPSSLEHGELAINYADGKIFYKNSSNSIVEFANLSGSFLPLSGGTLTGNLSLGDNVKATFGNNDLQIYHDGSASYIKENGTGDLIIQGSNTMRLQGSSNQELANFSTGGAVTLFNNGSSRLSTTSTGIDVTGGITADSNVKIDGSDELRYRIFNSGTFKAGLEVATTAGDMIAESQVGDFAIRSQGNLLFSANGNTQRLKINSSGIDVTGSVVADGLIVGGSVAQAVAGVQVTTSSAIPTGALAEANDGHFSIWNTNASAAYSGLSLRTRTSSSTTALISLDYNSSFNDGELAFRVRDSAGSSDKMLSLKANTGATFSGSVSATTNMVIGNGTHNELPLSFNSSSQDFSIGANGNYFMIAGHLSDLDSNQFLLVSNVGNVNIPNGSLKVGNTSAADHKIHVQTDTNALTDLINIDNKHSSGSGGALIFTQNSGVKGRIKNYFSGGWNLGFDTEDTTDALTIADNGNATFSSNVTVNGSTGLLASKIYAGEGTSSGTRSQLTRSGTTNRLHSFTGSTSATPFEIMMGTSHSALAIDTSSNVNIPNGGLAIAKTSAPDAFLDIDTGIVSASPSARFRRNHGAQAFQQLSGLSFYWNTSNGLQDNTIVYGASANSSLKFTHATGSAFHDRLTINSSGNATFSGSVTANAGISVDNITIDGNEIDVSSGDLTLDVAGDIILDADGADIMFKDGGLHFASIRRNGEDAVFKSIIQDKDVVFRGNDGGTEIVALTLDMSEAGAATFNSTISSGAITSTGLTVNAAQSNFNDSAGAVIAFQKSSSAKAWIANRSYGFHNGNGLAINTTDANPIRFGTNNTERLNIDGNGDISFYNNSAAQGLFWDSSTSRLGLGTTVPALAGGDTGLHIHATNYPEIKITNSTTGLGAADGTVIQGNGNNLNIHNREAGSISLATSNVERLNINSSGNANFSGSTSVTGSASANTSAITMGFTAPDGEIKVKNTTGAPASNLDFYTTNSSGTTAIAMRLTDEKDVSISRNLTMNGTLIGASSISCGAITSTGLTVEKIGDATAPTVALTTTSSNAFNHAINAFAPNLTTGEINLIAVGKEGSAKNSGYIGFKYNGDGSNSNLLTFGHWAADNLLTISASGNTAIPNGSLMIGSTTAPATNTKLHIKTSANQNIEFEETGSKLRISALNDARSANVPLQFASSGYEFLTGNATFSGSVTSTGLTASTSGNQVMLLDSTNGAVTLQMRNGSGSINTFIKSGIGGSSNLKFETGSADALTLDASQNVNIPNGSLMIGATTAPSSLLHIKSTTTATATIEAGGGGDAVLDLKAPEVSGAESIIRFSDSVSGVGFITYAQNDGGSNFMRFGTNSTERFRLNSDGSCRWTPDGTNHDMTLTADGNLLVGKTSTSSDVVGTTLWSSGHLNSTVSASYVARFNRKTSDGEIINLQKDGTTVGSIGSNGTYPYIGSHGTSGKGIKITDALLPSTNTGAFNDADVNLGASNVRWKDAHFSGTVFAATGLGVGTTSTNAKVEISGKDDAGASDLLRLQFDNVPVDTGITFTDIFNVVQHRFTMDAGNTNDLQISSRTQMAFHTNSVGNTNERMRLSTNGSMVIGSTVPSKTLKVEFSDTNTSTTNGGTKGLELKNTATATNTYAPIHFHANNAFGRIALKNVDGNEEISQFEFIVADDGSAINAMTIGSTGNVTITGSCTATSFPTSSDARLKDNIEDAKDSGDIIDKIKVRQFDWKKTGKHQDYGMIAQELILEVPDAVSTPTEDHEMMGVDYSKLVPLMMKEIQNLRKEIKSLKEKE